VFLQFSDTNSLCFYRLSRALRHAVMVLAARASQAKACRLLPAACTAYWQVCVWQLVDI
jgi:hypothetical protein